MASSDGVRDALPPDLVAEEMELAERFQTASPTAWSPAPYRSMSRDRQHTGGQTGHLAGYNTTVAPLTTTVVSTLLVAVTGLAHAAPSSAAGRATRAALADGIALGGVRFQRQQNPRAQGARHVSTTTQLDSEGHLPALWVGLQLRSGRHQYRLQLDAVRLATSALPAGRTIRAAASGAGAAWELLQPQLSRSAPLHGRPLFQAHGPAIGWPLADRPWPRCGWAPPLRMNNGLPLLLFARRAPPPDPDALFRFLLNTPLPAPPTGDRAD